MTLRIIDIERTGTDPVTDAIVEIASVDLRADGTVTNQVSTLVRPGIQAPPEASAVHHLLDQDLASAPPLMNAIHPFRGADAYVAHNADFERSFLGPLLGDASSVCTYKAALRLWPDLLAHNNQARRYRVPGRVPCSRWRQCRRSELSVCGLEGRRQGTAHPPGGSC